MIMFSLHKEGVVPHIMGWVISIEVIECLN